MQKNFQESIYNPTIAGVLFKTIFLAQGTTFYASFLEDILQGI